MPSEESNQRTVRGLAILIGGEVNWAIENEDRKTASLEEILSALGKAHGLSSDLRGPQLLLLLAAHFPCDLFHQLRL